MHSYFKNSIGIRPNVLILDFKGDINIWRFKNLIYLLCAVIYESMTVQLKSNLVL